jgi:hypothetical protein
MDNLNSINRTPQHSGIYSTENVMQECKATHQDIDKKISDTNDNRQSLQHVSLQERNITINKTDQIIDCIIRANDLYKDNPSSKGCNLKFNKQFPTYSDDAKDMYFIDNIYEHLEELLSDSCLSDAEKLRTLEDISAKVKDLKDREIKIKELAKSIIEDTLEYYKNEIGFKNCLEDSSKYTPIYKLLIESDVLYGREKKRECNGTLGRFILENEPGYLRKTSEMFYRVINQVINGNKITKDRLFEIANIFKINQAFNYAFYGYDLYPDEMKDFDLDKMFFLGHICIDNELDPAKDQQFLTNINSYLVKNPEHDKIFPKDSKFNMRLLEYLGVSSRINYNMLYKEQEQLLKPDDPRYSKHFDAPFVDDNQNMLKKSSPYYHMASKIEEKDHPVLGTLKDGSDIFINEVFVRGAYYEYKCRFTFYGYTSKVQPILDAYYIAVEKASTEKEVFMCVHDTCVALQRIHPFSDANGRILGLILPVVLLYEQGYFLTENIPNWKVFDLKTPANLYELLKGYIVKAPTIDKEKWNHFFNEIVSREY